MAADTLERTAEVAELVAMLDGEPECEVATRTTTRRFGSLAVDTVTPDWCLEPARWIARLACGHPVVICDKHHAEVASEHARFGVFECSDACSVRTPMPDINWLPL